MYKKPVTKEEQERITSGAIGGAILGGAVGGLPGLIIGSIIGSALAKESIKRKEPWER